MITSNFSFWPGAHDCPEAVGWGRWEHMNMLGDLPKHPPVSECSWPTKAPCSRRFPLCPVNVTGAAAQFAVMCFFRFAAWHLLISKLCFSDLWTFNILVQILSGAIIHFSDFWKLSVGHFCCTYKDLAFFCVPYFILLYYEDIWIIFLRCFCCGSL